MTVPVERPRLMVLNGDLRGRAFVLAGPSATIGRDPECEIVLDRLSVSRLHARVEERGGRFLIRDLGSRNGIRVGGRRVEEHELRHGDLFTVGDVQLRFEVPGRSAPTSARVRAGGEGMAVERRAEDSAPRPLTGRDLLAVLEPPATPEGGPGPGRGAAAQRSAFTVGLNLKMVTVVVLALAVSLGAGMAMLRFMSSTSPGTVDAGAVKIRVGENRWISCRRYGDFDEANIRVEDDNVVRARRYDRGELLLTGREGGSTTVAIRTSAGVTISLRVLVRGRLADPLEELTYARLDPAERRRRAMGFLEKGLLLEQTEPYRALQEYRKAVATLKPLPPGELYLRAKRRAALAEEEVERRWQRLRGEIVVAVRNNDLTRSMELLQEAVRLIPDPNDPRHQKARWGMRRLMREELSREKERRGRR